MGPVSPAYGGSPATAATDRSCRQTWSCDTMGRVRGHRPFWKASATAVRSRTTSSSIDLCQPAAAIPLGTVEGVVLIGAARPTGMFLLGYENDTWMVGHEPPATWLACCHSPRRPHPRAGGGAGSRTTWGGDSTSYAVQPVGGATMRRFPDGLLVCGAQSAVSTPLHGQGMTVALDAVALRDCLRRGSHELPRRYFRAAANTIWF